MCAFNKDIAMELDRKVLGHIKVSTLHALGLKTLQRAWKDKVGTLEINANREREIIKAVLPRLVYDEGDHRGNITQLVRMAKAYVYEDDPDLDWLMNEYECGPVSDETMLPRYRQWARDALALSVVPHPVITFDDMIYAPARLGITTGRYARVFVDETQDLNRGQLMLAENAVSARGKIIFVGDDRQAIYGFRGADSNSIPNIRKRFSPKELFLTTTYRCPKKVVALVQKYVPDFQAAPSAPEGIVEYLSEEKMKDRWRVGDFVIARVNAVLVSLCMEALASGIPAYMAGRDIGAGLIKTIERSGAQDIASLIAWVRQWQTSETARLVRAEEAQRYMGFVIRCPFRAPLLRSMMQEISENRRKDTASPLHTYFAICSLYSFCLAFDRRGRAYLGDSHPRSDITPRSEVVNKGLWMKCESAMDLHNHIVRAYDSDAPIEIERIMLAPLRSLHV
jgi:DNA helicase-2/ATP-dependent DNA helicase PcrA